MPAKIGAAAPLYQSFSRRQADQLQDSALMLNVGARLSQTVPAAMEPLQDPAERPK